MAGKPKRLSKVAREFNLGLQTIVDYLSEKSFEVESNPNTKISPEMYEVLVGEFQPDKALKEKSSKISTKKTKKETIVLEPDNAIKIDKEELKEEVKVDAEKKEEVISAKDSKSSLDFKVVGKIDLNKEEKEPVKEEKEDKPVVKTEEKKEVAAPKKEKTEKPEKTVEVEKVEKVVAKKEEVKADKSEEKAPVAEKKEEKVEKAETPVKEKGDEVIKARAAKLDGPKVLGKIVLPVEREKKKPEKKGQAANDANKRKRKRIRKGPISGDEKLQFQKGADRRGGGPGGRKGPGGNKREPKPELTEEQVKKQIQETLARLSSGKGKNQGAKQRRQKRDDHAKKAMEQAAQAEMEKRIIKVTEFVSANELANLMSVTVNDIISACMSLGMFVSINQRLDAETIQIVAEEFGFEVEFSSAEDSTVIEEAEDKEADLSLRAPIVTVMGHVDHGKTSLLDHIRKASVADGEAGGITQHIGAYSVKVESGQRVTFLDTPGHEAFTAMRARGAKVTDIAIIIIAADDQVMPQTKEAINHSQAAGVPMVFAINKIDKPGANPDRVREELSQMNILVEDWGGKYQVQEISAKQGKGIDELLEKVLLEAELMELKANPEKLAKGTIIESELDKGRGYVSTVLVQTGTLKVGSILVAGCYYGRVKAMTNEHGIRVEEAGPSQPVQLLGLNGAPQAGDIFNSLEEEKEAKEIAAKRMQLQREQGIRATKHISLEEIGRRIAIGDFQELNVIVKGDVDGSIEALSDSLLKLSTEQIQINVIHKSVGQISESDVLLATASDAIIVGFQVRPSAGARKLAEQEQIDVRLYSIIYQAIEELKEAMEGMLKPKIVEEIVANIEVRETFKISKVGTVAGCYVLDGKANRSNKIRLIRDGIVVYAGELGALKRFKDDVKEVAAGYECGLSIHNYNDIKVGDIVEVFEEKEVKQKLK